ncbi:ABC transporter ATP-binding protein [Nocardia sp. IBHARD005]|uniref:ABC transporter ATP-binding protein n=1 Tax=Nocardia sp. IBHARD005 TaxID=3457765 RepID=UPI00405937D2
MTGAAVRAQGLRVELAGHTIIDAVDLEAAPGRVTAVVGPNGSGKSTLLRAIYRATRPSAGTAHIAGHDVWRTSAREMARIRAVVTQHQGAAADFTVGEIVAMGRSPHKKYLQPDSRRDRAIVLAAMDRVGVAEFADRAFTELSGGERQRVLLARALAQQAPVILLDEPTNHLDIHAQLSLLELLRQLDATIVLAIHDLSHALTYADHVVVLHGGRVAAAGAPAATLTPALLLEVFGVAAQVVDNPVTGRPCLLTGLPQAAGAAPESSGSATAFTG